MHSPTDVTVEEVDGITNPSDIRKDMESKGSILLEFRFITNVRESTREHHKGPAQILQTISSIPERALKGDARSHQATYVFHCGFTLQKLIVCAA
jgi:hypothetical protein